MAILFEATFLLCLVVTSSSRYLSTSSTRVNTTNSIEQIGVNIEFDGVELSEYLRCSTCLNECVRSHDTLSYFFCHNCLRSCANQTKAFMYFFNTHQCSVKSADQVHLPQPPAKPKSAASTDFLDQYMDRQYFSDQCKVTKREYDDLKAKLSRCQVDLGNYNSGWYTSGDGLVYPEGNVEYDQYRDYTSDYEDYPVSGLDKENSAEPITTDPTTTLQMLDDLETTHPEIARFLRNKLSNKTTSLEDDIEIQNFTKEEIVKIITKFESMFVTKQQYDKLTSFQWSNESFLSNLKIGRSAEEEEEETVGRRAACPTRYRVYAPTKAVHRSGNVAVQVLQSDDYLQPFIYAECAFNKPTRGGLADAECRTISVQRTAVILVRKSKASGFNNCSPTEDGENYICREWINVAGACSLFL